MKQKMVASDGGGGGKLTKKVLGLGYWVQGFRCFPWLVVSFYLKDGLNVDPSILQILQSSANLPMVGKPLYGLVSDSVYISGQHRVPYIALGGTLIFTLLLSLSDLIMLEPSCTLLQHCNSLLLVPWCGDMEIENLLFLIRNGQENWWMNELILCVYNCE